MAVAAAAPSPPKPGRTRAWARLILSCSRLPRTSRDQQLFPPSAPPPTGGGGGGGGGLDSSLSSFSTPSLSSLSREMTTTLETEAGVCQGCPYPRKVGSDHSSQILNTLDKCGIETEEAEIGSLALTSLIPKEATELCGVIFSRVMEGPKSPFYLGASLTKVKGD